MYILSIAFSVASTGPTPMFLCAAANKCRSHERRTPAAAPPGPGDVDTEYRPVEQGLLLYLTTNTAICLAFPQFRWDSFQANGYR